MRRLFLVWLTVSVSYPAFAQVAPPNYDESQVPKHELPNPLRMNDGSLVSSSQQWTKQRRGEVLELFRREMYGRHPGSPGKLVSEVIESSDRALSGKAIRKQIRVYFSKDKAGPSMVILLYLPSESSGRVPMFTGLNFNGNHTVHSDPSILITESWVRRGDNHIAQEKDRGTSASRWQVETVLSRGYGLATIYYGDIDPDFDDGFQNGVHALFRSDEQSEMKPDDWGSIATWAWGLSRALDVLEDEPKVDAKKIAVLGHSRLGKTSLWAGAEDERFAIVISNDSGCGGAALSRRRFGESVHRINTSFPHWFCDNFLKYNAKEDTLPMDQHMLVALMAPRPVYIASAVEDRWADPHGEFLSALGADPVYKLLGKKGLGTKKFPQVNKPVGKTIGYHIRSGKHDVTSFDWKQYLRFADDHFRSK